MGSTVTILNNGLTVNDSRLAVEVAAARTIEG